MTDFDKIEQEKVSPTHEELQQVDDHSTGAEVAEQKSEDDQKTAESQNPTIATQQTLN